MNGNKNQSGLIYFTLFAIGLLLICTVSCDKINNPIIAKNSYSSLPSTQPDHITSTNDSTSHKVLLEDYMGHFCTNCPAAVSAAEVLLNGPNGNKIVSMEVNVGFDADTAGETGAPLVPPGLPDTAYKVDYTTAAGTAWDNTLVNSNTEGVPQGMVDRLYVDASYDNDLNYSNWGTIIDSIIATPQVASITMTDSCWLKQQIFGTAVSVTLKNTPVSGYTYFLEMAVVEDSVEDWQTNGGSAVQYFVHRYVLRSAINGPWGDELTLPANVPVTKYYTFTSSKFRYNASAISQPPQVPARLWNMAHCYIIAFLYQRNNGGSHDYAVLQAQILHI